MGTHRGMRSIVFLVILAALISVGCCGSTATPEAMVVE
jgi:PBP1b-binding outer membrane lipoprotein LpoB